MAVLVLTFIVGWVVPSIAAVLKEMELICLLEPKFCFLFPVLQEHIVALLSAVILAIGGVVCTGRVNEEENSLKMIIKKPNDWKAVG